MGEKKGKRAWGTMKKDGSKSRSLETGKEQNE
jgi:hypothetical protein